MLGQPPTPCRAPRYPLGKEGEKVSRDNTPRNDYVYTICVRTRKGSFDHRHFARRYGHGSEKDPVIRASRAHVRHNLYIYTRPIHSRLIFSSNSERFDVRKLMRAPLHSPQQESSRFICIYVVEVIAGRRP